MRPGERCEDVTQRIEFGQNRIRSGTDLKNNSGVDCVLACSAPMNETGRARILFCDESRELLYERNSKISRLRSGGGERRQIEEFRAALGGNYVGRGGWNDTRSCFRAGQSRFEIQHGLNRGDIGEERFDGGSIEQSIEERHEESVIFPSQRKNDFVR